jgi:glucosamine-6-phosphate deaminase
MCEAAAMAIAAQVMMKPNTVLGLPTGKTPLGVYEEIVRIHRAGFIDFALVKTFNLDEYAEVGEGDSGSYYEFMWDNLFSKINIPKENAHILNGKADDPDAECDAYEDAIELAGGIDLQLLGIGRNGHIGFNEPSDCFEPSTHVTQLDAGTLEANVSDFGSIDKMPKSALTMGIGTIMSARRIVLCASGVSKVNAVMEMAYGKVTPMNPASILQFHHDVTVITDMEAGAAL